MVASAFSEKIVLVVSMAASLVAIPMSVLLVLKFFFLSVCACVWLSCCVRNALVAWPVL
jgi:hypothetical protein